MQNDKEEAAEDEKATFRWLDLLRWAAAAVVALLAVVVLVGAILVVFRPDALDLKVVHGSVLAKLPPERPPASMVLTLHLTTSNPSGHVAIAFSNISVSVFTNDRRHSMPTHLHLDDIYYVLPVTMVEVISVQESNSPAEDMGGYFVKKLADGENIAVTVVVEGILTTRVVGSLNRDGRGRVGSFNGDGPPRNDTVAYTCLGITLGVDNSLNTGDDVSCARKSR